MVYSWVFLNEKWTNSAQAGRTGQNHGRNTAHGKKWDIPNDHSQEQKQPAPHNLPHAPHFAQSIKSRLGIEGYDLKRSSLPLWDTKTG